MVFHTLFNGIPFCKDLGVGPYLISFDPALHLGMRLSIIHKDPGLEARFTATIQADNKSRLWELIIWMPKVAEINSKV